MTDDRLGHLADVAARLWPPPHVLTLAGKPDRDGHISVGEYLVLPSRRHPRLLVPAGRRAAAAVVRHHGEGRHASARLKAATLALGLATGLGSLVRRERLHVSAPAGTRSGGLPTHLADVLSRDVVIGMHLGPPRANRKPVLQLLTPQGRTLAYAKLGVDPLTDGLVDQEAAALRVLASASTSLIEVPHLIDHGSWNGHRLLVQSSLPVWAPRIPLRQERLVAAAREIASIGGNLRSRLVDAPFWTDLDARLRQLPAGETEDRLREAVTSLERSSGAVVLSLGASHGDWTPWNVASLDGRLLVWDWERFRLGVPVGFDLLHYRLQTDLVSRLKEPGGAARDVIRDAAEQLRPLGVSADVARHIAMAYLADLATRYLGDRQREAGARLGNVGQWLIPALAEGIERQGVRT